MSYDMEQVWVCRDGICGMPDCLRCTTSERGQKREASLKARLDAVEAAKKSSDDAAVRMALRTERAEAELAEVRRCDAALRAEIERQQEVAERAEAALARAREVLREVEWIPLGGSADDLISICPKCRRFYLVGHFQGCALKAALEEKS